jgi:small-conductance mechanosensitive channel
MKTEVKNDLQRAEELMRTYAQALANLRAAQASIAPQVEACKQYMKEAETELLEIGEENRELFENGNLHLENGYLHIASNTVVETTRKFNWLDFLAEKPDLVKIDFERARIKKAWLDIDQHNDLIGLGVQVTTEEQMQVIANKI